MVDYLNDNNVKCALVEGSTQNDILAMALKQGATGGFLFEFNEKLLKNRKRFRHIARLIARWFSN